jgi:type IV secretion system protein TrbL
MKGVARAGAAMARDRIGSALGLSEAARSGEEAVMGAGSGGGRPAGASGVGGDGGMPAWAQRLRSEQNARHQRHAALQAVREGDHGGAGAAPDISERED